MMVMTTSSPGLSTVGAKLLATRLSDSLVLRVKTTSLAWGAPMRSAICWRTFAMASVASTDSEYRPRRGLAFMRW